MGAQQGPVTLRSIATAAFLPSALFSISNGAITPVIPLSSSGLGASPAMAAAVVASLGLGKLLADGPAGALTARFGERKAMIGAGLLCGLALTGALLAPSLIVFAVSILVIGMGTAVWMLARLTFVADLVPFQLRGRAMATLGGVQRIGTFLGPFIGAGAVHVLGTHGAYLVGLAATATATAVLVVVTEPAVAGKVVDQPPASYWHIITTERRTLMTLGVGLLLVSLVRSSRQVVVPLWGEHLGMTAAAVSIIYGISGGFDLLLSYPAGRMMDRRGRTGVAIISMAGMAIAHFMLPLSGSLTTFTAVAIAMGAGSGMGAGLGLTLGADVAPPGQRPVFFGVWRIITDIGNAAGPFLVATITSVAWLGIGVLSMGGVGVLAASAMGYWIPRRATPRDAPGA